MNLIWLKIFIYIVDSKSITSAAKKLYISPQALHQQMDLLEKELSCKLLIRSRKGVALTNAGQTLYQESQNFLKTYDRMIEKVKYAGRDENKKIQIATAGLIQDVLFPQAIHVFNESHPDISLKIIMGSPETIKDADIIVNDIEYPQKMFQLFTFFPIYFYAIMSSKHPLAGKNILTIDDLCSSTVLFPSGVQLHHAAQTIWEYARKCLHAASIEETDSAIYSISMATTIITSDKIGISCGFCEKLPSGLTQIRISDLQTKYEALYNVEKAKHSGNAIEFLTFLTRFYNEHWEATQLLRK